MQQTTYVRVMAATVLLAVGLTTTACGKKQAPKPQGGPPEVGVITVQTQRVALTTELSGRTSAQMVAEVRPQVSGIIQKRVVHRRQRRQGWSGAVPD
jgi:membrane fusion protein, multidrug efflux system